MSHSIQGLYAVCDNSPCPDRPLTDLAEELLLGGASTLQLRIKGPDELSRERRRAAAGHIAQLKGKFPFCFIINDDLELARDLAADGVHVGADDPGIAECRRYLGSSKIIGYSAHSLKEAREAEQAGADYVSFGAIFPSPTKGPDHPVQGLKRLRHVVETLTVPLVAIGGITEDNIQDVMKTGCAAAAMISALVAAPNVITATRMMLHSIQSA